jgi:hypothetical protein
MSIVTPIDTDELLDFEEAAAECSFNEKLTAKHNRWAHKVKQEMRAAKGQRSK